MVCLHCVGMVCHQVFVGRLAVSHLLLPPLFAPALQSLLIVRVAESVARRRVLRTDTCTARPQPNPAFRASEHATTREECLRHGSKRTAVAAAVVVVVVVAVVAAVTS